MALERRINGDNIGGDERNAREDRILEAAADLLVRYGYRKTTLDDVAREAGVGKGTIYLHWKDKNELFRAAIWRASDQAVAETLRRMRADPEGWQFHRFLSHGVLALLANPLLAALMRGRRDIFQGFMDSLDPGTIRGLIGNSVEHITKLQVAGLIRSDLPVPLITYLISALEVGLIYVSDLAGDQFTPSAEQLTEGLSDLVRRWLEPDQPPKDIQVAKDIMADWIEKIIKIANNGQ
jgi:AcrR family transcriptional regulator